MFNPPHLFLFLNVKTILIFLQVVLFSSCVTVNYVDNIIPITQKHHVIAVVPPRVTLERKIWMSDDNFKEITLKKQTKLHDQLVRSFQRRINEGRCFVEVLDPNATAYLAFSDGYNEGRIPPKELCKLLKVDAVLTTSIQILEPVSEFTAIFFQQTSGTTLVTNSIVLNASLVDTLGTSPIFTLNAFKNGTLGSVKEVMLNKIIRRTTRNTPYNTKKNPYRKLYKSYLLNKVN